MEATFFPRGPYKIPKLDFKDLLAWIINGSSVDCESMFDYILQPCLGQMASNYAGPVYRVFGVRARVSPNFLTSYGF